MRGSFFESTRYVGPLLFEELGDRALDQLLDGVSRSLGRLEQAIEFGVLDRDVNAFHRLRLLGLHAPDRSNSGSPMERS
jgi:hypothetical protein